MQLRNFGRPVQALGLSPLFKTDRSYLSGGRAGNLVLTVGGQIGTKSNATTTGVSTSGWLGSIGLGSQHGKDEVLHSGEGVISTIRWSLSGRYVVWVNEKGIKLMRSNLRLESGESDFAWKRFSHIDHPNRPGWDEMAGIWKAHVEWIDEAGLESDDFYGDTASAASPTEPTDLERLKSPENSRRTEKLVVGWSGTIWIINVQPAGQGVGKPAKERKPAKAEIVTMWDPFIHRNRIVTNLYSLRMDCTISGISLYTPNLLVVLAFLTPEEDLTSAQKQARRGVSRRHNALKPEVRIINIHTKEEVSVADTLNMSRYESLSATDYHLGVLPAMRMTKKAMSQRGTLETIGGGIEAIGGGIEAIGGGIWDATMYPARLFTASASVRSSGSPSSSKAPSVHNAAQKIPETNDEPHSSALTHGIKFFIQSPYDCIIATKPTISDHFAWLDSHAKFEEAWNLLDRHVEAAYGRSDQASDSTPSTPNKGTVSDLFTDESSQSVSLGLASDSQAGRKKLRVGEGWIQQLVSSGEWEKAGRTCSKVLGCSPRWEHWVTTFAQAGRFDDITPYIPGEDAQPSLPPAVYELMLGYYLSTDRPKFSELLQVWPPELFNVDPLLEQIQSKFKSGEVREDSVENEIIGRDWRILMECLAKLFLAVGRPRRALRCFIQLKDAENAMSLIGDAHLVEAVADDIPGFVLLRVSKDQQRSSPLSELASLTLDPVRLLVSEAHHGTVLPETVIKQLKARHGIPNPYLFFYFRALWYGDTAPSQDTKTITRHTPASERLLASEGKNFVSDFADTAVSLFAEYDRDLLMTFLKTSQSYTLSLASQICEQRHYIPELVYLLSKEGRTAQALRLIIDQLGDVSQAITFAKEQNDATLWDDLLDLSMSKPSFIRGLLQEVGTSIDPLKLVQRIPPGLEIEGLKEGLGGMLREFEVQESISNGVARVLRGEVNAAMQERSNGLSKGIRIDVAKGKRKDRDRKHGVGKVKLKDIRPGHCAGCGDATNEQGSYPLLPFPVLNLYSIYTYFLTSPSIC